MPISLRAWLKKSWVVKVVNFNNIDLTVIDRHILLKTIKEIKNTAVKDLNHFDIYRII